MTRTGLSTLLHSELHPAPAGHPESPRRLEQAVATLRSQPGFVLFEAPPATREQVSRVHLESYLKQVEALARTGGGHYDSDTYISERSLEASLAVSGAVIQAVKLAFSPDGPNRSLVIGRPPGHHAESDRAMGFCILNHVAVAAQYALDQNLCDRVTIVDFDLHHGNGTQEIFYARADVQYISTHQYPFYPGTGGAGETGSHDGTGYTLNFPLTAGSDDSVLLGLMREEIIPAITGYAPGLIIVSAGFDGHHADPLGSLAFTGEGFREVGRLLRAAADAVCDGRLVSYVEGGYNPEANEESILNYVKGIDSP